MDQATFYEQCAIFCDTASSHVSDLEQQGLCALLINKVTPTGIYKLSNEFDIRHLITLLGTGWDNFSRSQLYPVPHPTLPPADAFHTKDLWANTTYGDNRREFTAYLKDQFNKLGNLSKSFQSNISHIPPASYNQKIRKHTGYSFSFELYYSKEEKQLPDRQFFFRLLVGNPRNVKRQKRISKDTAVILGHLIAILNIKWCKIQETHDLQLKEEYTERYNMFLYTLLDNLYNIIGV